jgi:hypothetical protein
MCNYFFEEPATRVCWAYINIEESITKKNKKNNNLTMEPSTNPLPQEKQSPRSSKATAVKQHSARHKSTGNVN